MDEVVPQVQQKVYSSGGSEEGDGLPSLGTWEKTVLQLEILKKITGKVSVFFFPNTVFSSDTVFWSNGRSEIGSGGRNSSGNKCISRKPAFGGTVVIAFLPAVML